MKAQEILAHVDHTMLKATATWEEIFKVCQEAADYKMASACIPPSYVSAAKKAFGDSVAICTVIGFPLGYNEASAKVFEIKEACKAGASELDMVVGLWRVKNRDYEETTREIAECKKAAGGKILKVIVETCHLSGEEIAKLCKCVTQGGADYIKTSTGFGPGGAKLSDIEIFKAHLGPGVKMKASGGIRGRREMEMFLEAGCDRIGASSALKALEGEV